MAIRIDMPALSPTMEEGTLDKWICKDGDSINEGDVIAEIETDKAVMEMEAIDPGIIHILIPEETADIKVGALIAVLTEKDEAFKLEDWKQEMIASEQSVQEDAHKQDVQWQNLDSSVSTYQSTNPTAQDPEWSGDTKIITVRDALDEALKEELLRDENVFIMGEEVSHYDGAFKVTKGLHKKFGDDRIVDTPISEYGFTGLAVGASMLGLKPIVEYMTINFALQAADHILNSSAKTRYMSGGDTGVSIVFRGPNGSSAGAGAQHSQDFSSFYAQFPGLKVIAPFTAADFKGLLKASIRDNNPIMFLEHELLYGEKFPVPLMDDWLVPIGKAKVLKQGTDVTIVSYSYNLVHVLKAAEELEKDGISVEVIDLRTIRPLDKASIIESVKKTNKLVSVEESHAHSGIGAEIAAVLMEEAFDYLDAPSVRLTRADVPLPYAKNLETLALPQVSNIIQAVQSLVKNRK